MRRFKPFSINRNGKLIEFDQPQVMGILNVTPDSFYDQSRTFNEEAIAAHIRQMLDEGVDIIDVGAYSSRPGADFVSEEEEFQRLALGMSILRDIDDRILVSVDTFRSKIAEKLVSDYGVDIINDISGGDLDSRMIETVSDLKVPYIAMHMRGTPSTMQQMAQYDNVTADVIKEMSEKLVRLSLAGVNDVIIDPGFGFSKTIAQNYELMHNLEIFHTLEKPILVGVSRKSMIYNALNTTPQKSLNGTSILNTYALLSGASILRVHDVREAVEAVKLMNFTLKAN